MQRNRHLLIVVVILLFQNGCLYAARYDGTYRGKVVDQDTREPIEGVVVLGTWSVYHFGLAGGNHTYYDARETVTDKDGEFIIPGQGLRILSSLEPMSFVIFKVGYQYSEYQWETLKIDIPRKEEEQTRWEGKMPVFPLKKIAIEERRKRSSPNFPSEAPRNKIMNMLQEINKDRAERGLGPIGPER